MATTEHEINVSLSGSTVVFTGTGIVNGNIDVATQLGRIVFKLQDLVPFFPSAPIQWTRRGQVPLPQGGTFFRPLPQPPEATVDRRGDKETVIEVTNQPQEHREFAFFVLLQTPDGKFYGTDPTIVTMRPEGGSDGG